MAPRAATESHIEVPLVMAQPAPARDSTERVHRLISFSNDSCILSLILRCNPPEARGVYLLSEYCKNKASALHPGMS